MMSCIYIFFLNPIQENSAFTYIGKTSPQEDRRGHGDTQQSVEIEMWKVARQGMKAGEGSRSAGELGWDLPRK